MTASFDIIKRPPDICFTGNLDDIILKRTTPSALMVKMSVSIDDTTYCQNIEYRYDATGEIRVKTYLIASGLVAYTLPIDFVHEPFHLLSIRFIDESNRFINVTTHLVEGGVPDNGLINKDWWSHNFLTWQPQIVCMPKSQNQWLTFAKTTSAPKVIRLKTRLYLANGKQLEKTIADIEDIGLVRINVALWSLWARIEDYSTSPIAYDVYGLGLDGVDATEDTALVDYPFAQRYTLREHFFYDKCFVYQNSLGGFDSIMATGVSTYIPESSINTFINDGEEIDLQSACVSRWEQETGYVDDERLIRQWCEFFSSTNRYLYLNNGSQLTKIIVTEFEVKDKASTIGSYKFKYRFAKPFEGAYFMRESLPPPPRSSKFF